MSEGGRESKSKTRIEKNALTRRYCRRKGRYWYAKLNGARTELQHTFNSYQYPSNTRSMHPHLNHPFALLLFTSPPCTVSTCMCPSTGTYLHHDHCPDTISLSLSRSHFWLAHSSFLPSGAASPSASASGSAAASSASLLTFSVNSTSLVSTGASFVSCERTINIATPHTTHTSYICMHAGRAGGEFATK